MTRLTVTELEDCTGKSRIKDDPIFDDAFWKVRLYNAFATGRGLYYSIYAIDPGTWQTLLDGTRTVLSELLQPGDSLLDAGCGYGAVATCLPPGVSYFGVDLSPDFVRLAQIAFPGKPFQVADLRDLSRFSDHLFDFAFCRSIRGMVIHNVGEEEWKKMESELLRVAKKLILMEYHNPTGYSLLPSGE